MLQTLRRALRPARLRIPARRFSAGIAALPPTAREALGTDVSAGEAIAYHRVRAATATAVALYRSRYTLPMTDTDLHDAVPALDFPASVPSAKTRASIRAALAVPGADHPSPSPTDPPPTPAAGRPAQGGPHGRSPMFLVTPDPAHGLIAAPQSPHDLTPATQQALAAQGFAWNSEIEAYTRQADHGPAAVEGTADTLRGLGHYVFSTHTPVHRH